MLARMGCKDKKSIKFREVWAGKAIKTFFQGFRLARRAKGRHKKRRKCLVLQL